MQKPQNSNQSNNSNSSNNNTSQQQQQHSFWLLGHSPNCVTELQIPDELRRNLCIVGEAKGPVIHRCSRLIFFWGSNVLYTWVFCGLRFLLGLFGVDCLFVWLLVWSCTCVLVLWVWFSLFGFVCFVYGVLFVVVCEFGCLILIWFLWWTSVWRIQQVLRLRQLSYRDSHQMLFVFVCASTAQGVQASKIRRFRGGAASSRRLRKLKG